MAKAAGVHRATVSLAFKNHPSLPQATRDRIQKIAEEMGYRPDPVLSALSAYRSSLQIRSFHGVIAWLAINDDNIKYNWRNLRIFTQYYEGAKERADKYGYQLEVFEMTPDEMSFQRMASILKARNVNGILLCPQPHAHMVLDFKWDDFSFITFGYTLMEPKLHTVTSTQYRSTCMVMEKMHQRGYRKIAFAFSPIHDERTDHNFLAAYLVWQQKIGEKPIIIDFQTNNGPRLKRQLEELAENGNKVEAIVSGSHNTAHMLEQVGVRVPQDVAIACPLMVTTNSSMSGVCEDGINIGRVAVDHLTNMMLRGERGIPERALRIHAEGIWAEGRTLPDLRTPKKKAKKKRTKAS
ncbi:LacI family DNA-binding transcriptional regulator [Ruficoccus sp. ZRK36]|uniref:LacI family DNA-binding transcriptional regulator n=1 Tax=Ruficoccus sp. ZRK36 TaxID=2866311 RepID=UPI001C72C90D|nr:LacI family DNA-binding transcriptional regulator [Ruficoccus sp. ZRK36]QYY35065.1 LacI family transcriptional regulator [Ruficoccus sp. ZRK36]